MKALRTGLAGALVMTMSFMVVGCGGTAEEAATLLDSLNSIAEATASAIDDGTSNTIQIGEQTGGGASNGGSSGASPAGGASNAGAPTIPSTPVAGPVVSQAAIDALGDKVFSFGTSSGNSDNNAFVTGTTDLQLCRFGKFGMRETTFFSSNVGSFESTDNSVGSWTVLEDRGRFLLRLTIEQSDASNPAAEKNFEVVFSNGGVSFDRSRADVSDATADCAAAQQASSNP